MVELIRFLIAFIVGFIAYRLIRKKPFFQKMKWRIIFFVICFVFYALLFTIRFEYYILSFPSVESSYSFSHSAEIMHIEYGEDSALVLDKLTWPSPESQGLYIFPKSDDGENWKLNIDKPHRGVATFKYEEPLIFADRISWEQDIYIVIGIIGDNNQNITISDTQGDSFAKIDIRKGTQFYITHFTNQERDYALTVNGETVTLDDFTFFR